MVGGLVMGALEKLYRQPSLLVCALLAARANFARLGKRAAPKKPCPPPTSTQVGPGCAFQTRLPRSYLRRQGPYQEIQPTTLASWTAPMCASLALSTDFVNMKAH